MLCATEYVEYPIRLNLGLIMNQDQCDVDERTIHINCRLLIQPKVNI
jgi:hypothetical protein